MEYLALLMFVVLVFFLLLGYPVAFTLGGTALLFGLASQGIEFFDLLPLRIWGTMTNFSLLAVPLFIFMGVMLEKSGLAEDLLETMGLLFGRMRGGLAVSIVVVGALLAATTGVVGATVVTMGVIALPAMLKHGYQTELATGTIAASGTLGQVIPPSVILVLLGDVMGISVGSLFMAAVLPGLILVGLFLVYVTAVAFVRPERAPALKAADVSVDVSKGLGTRAAKALFPALALIVAVLGSIFFGIASPTESAAVGALGAIVLAAAHGRFKLSALREVMESTTRLTSMVFIILVGAAAFGLVFRGMGGDQVVHAFMTNLPGQEQGFLAVSMLLIFALGFVLDFLEICFIVVPILAPVAAHLGIDLLWFAVLIGVNLQTSFLTPPFGFSLFYLKGVAPPEVQTMQIYRGIVPFVVLQVIGLALLILFPQISLWLPSVTE